MLMFGRNQPERQVRVWKGGLEREIGELGCERK